MDVGQVKFSILADNLTDTLEAAKELQSVLNDIDGKKVTAGAGKALDKAAKSAEKTAKNEDAFIQKRIASAQKYARLNERNQRAAEKLEERRYRNAERAIIKRGKLLAKQQKEEQRAAQEIAEAPIKARKNWQQMLVNAGAQMQTLGATLQRVTSPFTNVYRGLTMGIGYRMLGKVMQSIEGSFSRYDIMQTYAKNLKELGLDATKKFAVGAGKAQTAAENLNDAVLGLPTGLDEIIASMRKYAGATGDIEKATKLAIAANNAYIAGSMDARQQLFTERQLLSLAGGAELSENQWDSLRRNAPLAMRTVAKAMKMNVGDMITALKKGEISGQKFLDVFVKVGTQGKISKAAQVMKNTWSAVSQNFQNAMNRMGEGILKSLDTVFESLDGRTFLQHVLGVDKKGNFVGGGIRGVIDDMSQSVQKWITSNPDKILNFFDNLSKIDWKGIAGGFAEFGFMMGRVYAAIGKVIGNGKFIKAMLWTNLIGKGIQLAGGLTKGTAGIMSWILTLAKFGVGGKIASAINTAQALANGKQALTGAAETMSATALSWQGVASKAISVAAIPAIAWALKQVALALQEFDKVNIDWGSLVVKLGQASLAVSAFAVMAGALGAVMTSTPVGWVGALIEGTGVAMIAAISGTMIAVAKGLNDISKAEIPDSAKINEVIDAIDQIGLAFQAKDPFEAIGIIFDAWSKNAELDAVSKVKEAFQSIQQLGTIKISEESMSQAESNIRQMGDFINQLETIINGEEGVPGTTNGAGWRRNTLVSSQWRMSIDDFARQVGSISSALMNMQSAIDQLKALQGLESGVIDVGKISELATNIDNALAELEKVGKREVQIAVEITADITGADEVIKSAQDEIDKIKKAIEGMEDHYEKKIYVYLISGGVFGGWNIIDAVRRRINDIRQRIAGIDGSITKHVSVSTSESTFGGGGGGGHMSKVHRGGKIHPLYRANGGFISRGTDTVPAMLTPGEFVLNRMAASRIGDSALWKLNHMDIAGAVRALSSKIGQSASSHIVNYNTNNTRNATVNLNNYNGGSMGTVRASRWAKQL